MIFLIYDPDAKKYYQGSGRWSSNPDSAKPYTKIGNVKLALNNLQETHPHKTPERIEVQKYATMFLGIEFKLEREIAAHTP